jgi:hypothetical protein
MDDSQLVEMTRASNQIFGHKPKANARESFRATGPASASDVHTFGGGQTNMRYGAKMRHWVVIEDDEGNFIQVADFSYRVDSSDLDDAHGAVAVLPDIRTVDGTTVKKLSKGKYKVGDKIFTTKDPIAP